MSHNQTMTEAQIEAKIEEIRADFPFFVLNDTSEKGWAFLDNAATTQKPKVVIDALVEYYTTYNANIHRGLYELSERATQAYEDARSRIAEFLGANRPEEVIFTRGATESLNLLASCWGKNNLKTGDEILITDMEHHANIVPWQIVAESTGAELVHAPVSEEGVIDADFVESRIRSGRVKCLSLVKISNALGVVNDVERFVRLGKEYGVFCIVDGAQSVTHFPVNLKEMGCDAFVFSGHKIFGPTGIGVLWANYELLDSMPPYQAGGDMIKQVSFSGTTFAKPPSKYEAGTPHISGAIGLGAAIDYVDSVGFEAIEQIDAYLFKKTVEVVERFPHLKRVGRADDQVGVVSFYSDTVHPSDLASMLAASKVAVRTGHHCAQPLMDRFGIPGTVRVSFSMYNNLKDLEKLSKSLDQAFQLLV
jgi:cysteine desulfurase/selenocysteine lyase